MDCDVNNRVEKLFKAASVPLSKETHWVECKGYRCLAILDENGKWRCFATGKELTDVVKVYST